MVRFIHTADWQLGGRGGFSGELGQQLAHARVEAVRNILELARKEPVDFILVAGDVFESHQVSRRLLYQVKELLGGSPCPVFLLPGNHDPLVPDSIYLLREEWRQLPDHVRVLSRPEPVPVRSATLFPCPCTSRWSNEDPTAWIPPRAPSDGIRIGVAHGTWNVSAAGRDADWPIPTDAALVRDLDYLALGHVHARPTSESDIARWRAAYPGTPEPAAFDEEGAGYVLLVTIDAPNTVPKVELRNVATTRRVNIDWSAPASDPAAALRDRLSAVPDPRRTVLRLRARGALNPDGFCQVQNVIDELKSRFLHLEYDLSGLTPVADDGDIESLLSTQFLRDVARRLRDYAQGGIDGAPSLVLEDNDWAPAPDVPATARAAILWLLSLAARAGRGNRR